MKITVNKNQQKINLNTHVANIITIAQQTAEKGGDTFTYHFPRGLGFDVFELGFEVRKQTEDSVFHFQIVDWTMNFCIRN